MQDFFAGDYMSQKIVEQRLRESRMHFATPRPRGVRRNWRIAARIGDWTGHVAATLRGDRRALARGTAWTAH